MFLFYVGGCEYGQHRLQSTLDSASVVQLLINMISRDSAFPWMNPLHF